METFATLGAIISHGYLGSGYLPIRIALPTLICILLGPTAELSNKVLVEAFINHLSDTHRDSIKDAIKQIKLQCFTKETSEEILSILSHYGCIDMPTPANLNDLILKVAKFQFYFKPTAAVVVMHAGIPTDHKKFWETEGVQGILNIYSSLSISCQKILSLLKC